jgi:gamma-tubulin complex component 2
LESLLELALRTSNARHDPFKDDLGCYLQQLTLMQKVNLIRMTSDRAFTPNFNAAALATESGAPTLKRLEGFTLAYKVRWPLSLIISKKTLTKYQLIFRHLFYCKHVERQLSATWLNHQSTKELDVRSAFLSSYALRHRMLMFLQNLSYYMMVEVLEPNWHQLEVDYMHDNDLKRDQCMEHGIVERRRQIVRRR